MGKIIFKIKNDDIENTNKALENKFKPKWSGNNLICCTATEDEIYDILVDNNIDFLKEK